MNSLSIKFLIGALAITVVFGGLFAAQKVEAFSMQELVTALIERGIISPEREEAARKLATFFGDTSTPVSEAPTETAYPNAEQVAVKASQLIQFSSRTYASGEDIEGIILNVENMHTEPVKLSGRAQCHVSYRIESASDRSVLYNSADHEPCVGDETSFYYLEPSGVRMFEITHSAEDFELPEGEYVMVMEYPGYGEGERVVTIKQR